MKGYTDWHNVNNNSSLPHTCCPNVTPAENSCNIDSINKYDQSCLEELKKVFQQYGSLFSGIAVGIILTQVLSAL